MKRAIKGHFCFIFFVTLFNGTKIFVFPNDVYLMALFNKDRIPSGSLLMSVILLTQFLLENMLKIGTVNLFC